ncbi:MAG: hypothetical protein P8N51_00340 [Pseudomonadales bacterium]|jgi:hypothetical protein|nr:hypothetical protein [Pseudomonadales bacterium]MDG1443125.1 hypothetical protein [Pseudomonadales bacterium]
MRELTKDEMREVSGGFGVPGVIIGAGIGAFGAASKKAPLDQVLLAALFGGAAGAAGNLAASAASGGIAMRVAWGLRSGGLSFISGAIGESGAQQSLNMPSNGGDLLRMGSQERY